MKAGIIKKTDLAGWLDSLIKKYEVFAPVNRDGLVSFNRIASGSEACLEYENSKTPPKHILFPQSETLFSYQPEGDTVKLDVPATEQPRLIFGIRPCDAASFTLLDKALIGEQYTDPYYANRRDGAIMVGLGCTSPRAACFCTSVGGGPFSTRGLDLLLTDIGDEYVVQATSDRGTALLEAAVAEDASQDKLNAAAGVAKTAEASMGPGVDVARLKEELDNRFYDPIWQQLTEKCLSCGVCTYLCPTCYCFDLVDEATGPRGAKVRTWDSCQFPQFTLHASGANPRPTSRERFRQRIMHKFSFFLDSCDQIACVGCGRCVAECPVNLDIRQVVNTISQMRGSE